MEKKKKKTKYQPLDISMTVVKSTWAEDVEDGKDLQYSDLNALREKLPSAPKATRQAYDISQLSSSGPWKAKLSNLPFNVKEEEIIKFLGGESEVKDIDIPYSGNRMRGYAVAEFVSRDALANALQKNEDSIMGRRIPINIYTNEDGYGGYHDGGRDTWGRRDDRRPPRDDDDGDWRSAAIQNREETIGRQERSSPANGDWSRGPSRRPWQDDDSRPSRRFDSRSTYDRYESGERDGPRRDWNRDSDRSDYRSDRDRDYDRRRERPNFDRDNRDYNDGRDRRDGGRSYDKPMEKSSESLRERPRLNLQPRSKPVDAPSENGKEITRSSSIFGGAKPVDTASKEREIESRMDRDKGLSSDYSRRRFMGSESSLTEKEDMPPGGAQVSSGGARSFRSRKSSDSSSHGKVRASSSNNSPGMTARRGSDSEPTSPPARAANETSTNAFSENTRRQPKAPSVSANDEDDAGNDSRNRRSSTTSGDSSQPTVQVVDAPPPSVNVWQVRRSQMQKRAEAAAASATTPDSDSARIGVSANNNNATSTTATLPSRSVSNQSLPNKEESSAVEEVESSNVSQSFTEEQKHSAAGDDHVTSEIQENEKEERVTTAPSQTQPPRRPPVVVSVSAAQRAAAEGQPPPPPIHENAWHHSQGAMDSVRRPPSPVRLGSGNLQSSYSSERAYQQYQSHHPHSGHNEWQDSGARMQRMDYRDNSGGYRGSGYRGGGGNRSGWRGRGGRGGYRGRGRGGYRYSCGNEPGSADM